MSLPGSTLRRRRTNLRELVTNLDAFTKTAQEVTEEKSTSGGIVSAICFTIIGILCIGELSNFFFGDPEYEYKFSVDTAYNEQPNIELDMIIATPCASLSVQLPDSFPDFDMTNGFKKDPTRFEFTEEELVYWNKLKKAQGLLYPQASVFKGLEKMTFIDGGVEEGLEQVAKQKQKEEEDAIEKDKKNDPGAYESHGGAAIVLFGNGMSVFQIISSNSEKDEGTACRVHGRIQISKVRDDSILIAVGKGGGVGAILEHLGGIVNKGNVSHRIEKLNFGPRIPGLVTPLAGTEQISASGKAEYRYFLQIVPTKIFHGLFGRSTTTFQYSVTSTKKIPKEDEHLHSAIVIHYDFAATVIEVRAIYTSAFQLLIRLCSVVGGVFATSSMLHSLFRTCLCLWTPKKHSLVEKSFVHPPKICSNVHTTPLVQDL